MAQLVIKGHPTRGREVIEILEMLGGKNSIKLIGSASSCGYYIDSNGNIAYHYYSSSYFKDAIQFTIEEFLEKFPYKVGDKVWLHYENSNIRTPETIICMHWDNKWNCVLYNVSTCCNLRESAFTPYKEETMEERNKDNWAKWDLPDGYEFQDKEGNVIKTDVIKLVKKQSQYPKTYEECCKIKHSDPNFYIDTHLYSNQLESLYKLLICRDAYWKIAGEQMGLGKPWEPRWYDSYQKKWIINFYQNEINFTNGPNVHFVLAFPTSEIQDEFYENFKGLIELVKELL